MHPLVANTDDALAIIGPGEEIHLEFAALDGPPPTGWTRRLVLESNGWCKDMDLFTHEGETVGPMPVSRARRVTRSRTSTVAVAMRTTPLRNLSNIRLHTATMLRCSGLIDS